MPQQQQQQDNFSQANYQKKKGGGCWKATGIGCLIIFVTAIVGGYFGVKWLKVNAHKVGGAATVLIADGMLTQLGLPQAEKEAAMVPIRKLADKIKNKEVTSEQAKSMVKAVFDGPLPFVIMARAGELKYLVPSELPEQEKQEGHVTLTRFARGVMDKSIPQEKSRTAWEMITDPKPGSSDDRELKESLTTEELKAWLACMKQCADEAGVENKEFKVDIGAEIQKAIDAGLATAPAQQ